MNELHDLDTRDWEIIELLRAGMISNSAVAKELGVSEGMIRQRIKRLRGLGILSLRGLINPDILANRQVVCLGANVVESHILDSIHNRVDESTQSPAARSRIAYAGVTTVVPL